MSRMSRTVLWGILGLALLPDLALGQGTPCDANTAWARVRQAYPIHAQVIAQCESKETGDRVIVITEPPPHLVRAKAEAIAKALFSVPIASVQRKRHALGFDGWAEDLVVVARPRGPEQIKALGDDLALVSLFVFGSAYKAEAEDIARLAPARFWDAPPALEVGAEELFAWLIGPKPELLVPVDGGGGTGATLGQLAERKEIGTYQTQSPGLIVALLPAGDAGDLNDHVEELRRFALDTDAFLGALSLKQDRVALVGRERTASLAAVPPLRIETLLLLASYRSAQLSQSYERRRAFAGKLLGGAGDLFGWDWAPVLLSDVLNDTEFGSLLNFTDDMLKGWSESGTIEYKGFGYEKPKQFPFGDGGAFKLIAAKALIYNWNTAGVGFVSTKDDVDIFAVRNTGSLPVSYFPEGSEPDEKAKAKLLRAEDTAYRYFSSLRNPMLGRAVQYAALFQVFQTFDLQAKPPHDQAPAAASITTVESLLEKDVNAALAALAKPTTPSTSELQLSAAFLKFGNKGRELESRSIPAIDAVVKQLRVKTAAKIAELDKDFGPSWRESFAKERATGEPMPEDLKGRVTELDNEVLAQVLLPNGVRESVVAVTRRDPEGWIRTPSIVVSRGAVRDLTGGHNIGGLPTRVELDPDIPKGSVEASGSYETGRVLRINPADAPAIRDIVRTFDREVGLHEENVPQGLLAVEAKLHEGPVVARPVRPMAVALELGNPAARVARGAQTSANAVPIGYRPGSVSGNTRAQIEALAEQSQAQVAVARVDEGFAVLNPQSKRFTLAPNPTSLYSALGREMSEAPGTAPKIVFMGLTPTEVDLAVRNMAARDRAAGDAGGKPPFGGGRRLAFFDDGKEPGRNSWAGKPPEEPPGLGAGGARKTILAIGKDAPRMMKSEPKWEAAEVTFISPNSVVFAHAPVLRDGYCHIAEVKVPVAAEGGRLKRMVIDAIGRFRNLVSGEGKQAMDAAVTKVFKPSTPINVEAALQRYKDLMRDEFHADDVWIKLQQQDEGGDVIVTEGPRETDVTEAPQAAAPRG
jgi:hypothetical protein